MWGPGRSIHLQGSCQETQLWSDLGCSSFRGIRLGRGSGPTIFGESRGLWKIGGCRQYRPVSDGGLA